MVCRLWAADPGAMAFTVAIAGAITRAHLEFLEHQMTTIFLNPSTGSKRRRGGSVRALSLVLLASSAIAGTVQAQTATDLRENAVWQARAGKMAEAQNTLRALLVSGPDDGLVAMDLVTLLEQDGKPLEAAVIFTRANKSDAPAYAVQAAVRANQALGRDDEARRLLSEGTRRFPGDPVWAELEKRPTATTAPK